MTKKNKYIRYLLIGLSFLFIFKGLYIISVIQENKYSFKGVIEKITYDEKRAPNVVINGKQYSISSGWQFNEKMSIGDSLIKEKGSMTYKLIKHSTEEMILSN